MTAALRVLLTHERFPPDVAGGGEYVVQRVAEGLLRQGAEVRVLTTGDPAATCHEGVATERLPVNRYALNARTRDVARAARWADIIHTHTYHAAWPSLRAGRRLRKPVVCTVLAQFGAGWRQMRGPVVGRAFAAWERWLVSRPFDRVVFLSDASRAMGVAARADPARNVVLPPGLDHARFRPGAVRNASVVFAGRMDARKGIHQVVAAARALPNVPFHAVGWGEGVAAVRAVAPGNMRVEESQSGPAYAQALSRARIFLFPSHAETFGLVVAEAMASGCAVVSSVDTVGFAGARVAADDLPGIVAAVRALWDDPARSAAAGAENRRLAARYAWPAHVDGLLGLYADSLGAVGRAG